MRIISLYLVVIYFPAQNLFQRLQPPRNYYQIDDEDDESVPYVIDDVEAPINQSEKGMYLGSPCDFTCSPKLHHVFCDPITGLCECEKKYPVKIGPTTGCGKPKKLGEQCFYKQSCLYNDQHSSCIQIHHNAVCQCTTGYHSVALQRPTKRQFCAEDLELLTSDFSALAGVITGIAVLSGLICFVLKLFTQARSPRPRHFANANLAPPILFSSDTGIPLTVHGGSVGRSTSRASSQRTFVSSYSRRPSSAQGSTGRGVLVSASRAGAARAAAILLISCHVTASGNTASDRECDSGQSPQSPEELADPVTAVTEPGSRRPSLASVHSSGSSVRSYSAKRFEKEREQKEEREMQLRLIKMHNSMSSNMNKPPTPSPQSTDELLPSGQRQVPLAIEEECASTSFQNDLGPGTSREYI